MKVIPSFSLELLRGRILSKPRLHEHVLLQSIRQKKSDTISTPYQLPFTQP